MVRRQIPLSRRIKANLGTIANVAIWTGAVLACTLLYAFRAPDGSQRAVALVERASVVAPESGRLATMQVQLGDSVTVGQALGTLDVPGLDHELAAAEAQLRAVTVELEQGDPDRTRRFVKDAASAQARYLGAKVALESDRAALIGLSLEVGRLSSAGAGVAAAELEAKKAERDTVAARIAAQEAEVAGLERTYAEVKALRADGTDPSLEAQVEAAAAEVARVKARLDEATLRAPAAGVIAALPRGSTTGAPIDNGTLPEAGTWLPAGTPVLQVVSTSTHDAVLYVSPGHARAIVTGEAVTLASATGEVVPAKVASVAAAVEPIPLRQLVDPAIMQWGVPVTVRADAAELMPGEAFDVSF